jgi:CheY-like chemotaxis protein
MGKNVLVVEDDSGIGSLVKEALEADGFEVSVEKDGDVALAALRARLPDLIVTDLLLPTLSGFDLLEKLRALPGGSGVPSVVMSGIYKSARHKKVARETHGVAAFLEKPFRVDELIAAARTAVGLDLPTPKRPTTTTTTTSTPSRKPKRDAAESRPEAAIDGPRGNLRHTRFPELLAQLYRTKATGGLLLRRGRIKKIVTLTDGAPTFVKSNLVSECLGRILVREKLIKEDECERSLQLLPTAKGKLQGALLVEMGALSPQNLRYGLQLQLEHKLFDVFSWPEGDYHFDPRAEAPTLGVTLDLPLPMLIYEGVRRKLGDDVVAERLEATLEAYLGPHPEALHHGTDLPLDDDEKALLAFADGTRTVRDVLGHRALAPKAARQLAYAMLASEVLQSSRRPLKPAPPSSTPERPPSRPPSSQPPPLPSRRSRASDVALTAPTTPAGTVEQRRASVEPPLDTDELRRRLLGRARLLKRLNHFEILGVSPQAGPDELERAYAAEREALPRAADVAADLQASLEQIGRQLSLAYETLIDARRRAEYQTRLAAGQRAGAVDELHKLLAADAKSRRGEHALEAGRYAEAAEHFREALALSPDEGELQAMWAWAVYRQSPEDPVAQVDAIQRLERAVELAPRFDRGWLWLGRVVHRAGRPGEAIHHFERAVACNPDNREALTELKHG